MNRFYFHEPNFANFPNNDQADVLYLHILSKNVLISIKYRGIRLSFSMFLMISNCLHQNIVFLCYILGVNYPHVLMCRICPISINKRTVTVNCFNTKSIWNWLTHNANTSFEWILLSFSWAFLLHNLMRSEQQWVG